MKKTATARVDFSIDGFHLDDEAINYSFSLLLTNLICERKQRTIVQNSSYIKTFFIAALWAVLGFVSNDAKAFVQPNAGKDTVVCDSPTFKLVAASNTQVWSSLTAPATIDAQGNITGMNTVGTYSFVLTEGSDTDTVRVIRQNGQTRSLCAGDKYRIKTQTGLTNIQWYKDGSPLSGSTADSLIITSSGQYTYTAIGADGCPMSLCCPISIVDSTCTIACVKPNAGKDTVVCDAPTFKLTAATGTQTWSSISAPATIDAQGNIAGMNTVGTYQFVLTDEACSDTVKVIRQNSVTKSLCSGEKYRIKTQTGLTNIQWYKDGSPLSGSTADSLIITSSGQYTYTANDSNGCPMSLCCPIIIVDSTCVKFGTLGSYVWEDTNKDGIQDLSEPPVSGVKVYLYDAITMQKIDSTVTNATGEYLFDSLLAGQYSVQFVAPAGRTFTYFDAGSNNDKDSDAKLNGMTAPITIDTTKPEGSPLRDVQNVDAGITPGSCPSGTICVPLKVGLSSN
jgi:hypothetical protein